MPNRALALALFLSAACSSRVADHDIDRPENPREALQWLRRTRASDDGRVRPDGLERANAHRRRMLAAGPADNGGIQPGSWTWLGPGNVGGRIRSIWIKPNDASVMVIGSVTGGLWRTTDGGGRWVPVDDFLPSLAIGCMASPRGSSTTLYAGTGELVDNSSGQPGLGIYRSVDAGKRWGRLTGTANSDFKQVAEIAISPTNASVLLAATNAGIMRSKDTALTWSRVLSASEAFTDVHFHPSSGAKAVASRWGRAYYSTDAGRTWTGASGIPSTAGRIELAYARTIPQVVYALIETNMNDGAHALYRSLDGGVTYTKRAGSGLVDRNAWWNNALWVDPTHSARLVIGGVSLWRSVDAGASFVPIQGVHADQHVIVEHPGYDATNNKTLFVCNDGGIFRTDDITKANSSSGWTVLNNELGITQFYGGAVSAGGVVFGGTQDNGTQVIDSFSNHTARKLFHSDGMENDADPVDPLYLYGEKQNAGVFRSSDGGKSAESIVNNLTDSGSGKAPWVAPMRIDRNLPNRMWLGSRRLWRTNNVKAAAASAVHWTIVHSAASGDYSAVEVAPTSSLTVVCGSENGDIYRTVTGSAAQPSWTKVDQSNLPDRSVLSIAISPRNPLWMYAAFGGYNPDNLWFTANGGLTWNSASGTGVSALPPAPIHDVVIHPRAKDWLYVATEVGVFASTDAGATWSTGNDGPANVMVQELVIRKDGSLYAFTHGRGIYRAHAGPPRDASARTMRASLTWTDAEATGPSHLASPSGDARWIAYSSDATDMSFRDTNGVRDVFVRDRQAGITRRVSNSWNGSLEDGISTEPAFAAWGRYVAFQSAASNMVRGDSNKRIDVFVRDLQENCTERVSVHSNGAQADGTSQVPSITPNARFVSFQSSATNLVANDTNRVSDVFRRDRDTGRTKRVSVGANGVQGNGPSWSTRRAMTDDGKIIAFQSLASNLVPGDTNFRWDVFVRDERSVPHRTIRVSSAANGNAANGHSSAPAITGGGRYVVYYSAASDLVAGDTNGKRDIFLWDLVLRTNTRISLPTGGGQANGHSFFPIISRDGRVVVFDSVASNLVPGDTNRKRDVFRYEIGTKRLTRISVDSEGRQGNVDSFRPMPDDFGKFVAFRSDASNLVNADRNRVSDIFLHEDTRTDIAFPIDRRDFYGSSGTTYPLGQSSARVQQAARETIGRNFTFRRLSFRRDNGGNNATARAREIDLEMVIGSTDIDAMTTQFSSNWRGSRRNVVRRKPINLPDWRFAPIGISNFSATIPLDAPYNHNGQRHLLWEIRVFANTRTDTYMSDAHSGRLTLTSTSAIVGVGCNTNAGPNYGHLFAYTSDGPTSSLRVQAFRAPKRSLVALALGATSPNLPLPGLCTRIYTDAALQLPLGRSDDAGGLTRVLPLPAWDPDFRGAVLYSQLLSPDLGQPKLPIALSYGRRIQWPTRNPGPTMRRVFASSRTASTGTLQDLGAVFKVDG